MHYKASPDLLLSYPTTPLASHITIILIITLTSKQFQPLSTPESIQVPTFVAGVSLCIMATNPPTAVLTAFGVLSRMALFGMGTAGWIVVREYVNM